MKKKYGYMPCPDCGERVTVKINEQKTLSYTCDECDSSAYCREGAGNRARWESKITGKVAAPAAAPAKPGEKKADAPAAAKKSTSIFDL